MVFKILQTFFDLCSERNIGLAPTEDGSVIAYEGENEMVIMFQNSEKGDKLTIEFYESENKPNESFKKKILDLFSEAINKQPIK